MGVWVAIPLSQHPRPVLSTDMSCIGQPCCHSGCQANVASPARMPLFMLSKPPTWALMIDKPLRRGSRAFVDFEAVVQHLLKSIALDLMVDELKAASWIESTYRNCATHHTCSCGSTAFACNKVAHDSQTSRGLWPHRRQPQVASGGLIPPIICCKQPKDPLPTSSGQQATPTPVTGKWPTTTRGT